MSFEAGRRWSPRSTTAGFLKPSSRWTPALTTFALVLLIGDLVGAGEFPDLRGPYLGQVPPEAGVEVFAPGVLKPESGFHSSVVFNSTGDWACWTAMSSGETYCSRRSEERWTPPELLPFDPEFGVREPMFAHGDRRLYYLSRRPLEHDPVNRERIWFVERTPSGWSEPRVIDEVVTSHPTHWQFSFTAAGDLYFTSEIDGVRGEQDIYVSRWRNGSFTAPESLGARVNSDERDFCPFVAPDESYLIFSRSVPEARGRSDLFISFHDGDGTWTEAMNMGDVINSMHNETSPVVTPDGRYLFFLRVSGEVNDVYWTKADVIESLRRHVRKGEPSSRLRLSEIELLAGIEEFERAIQGQPRETVHQLLWEHTSHFKGRTVEVTDATIASRYTRENRSRIYFGFNYDPNDHLFLSEIDPPLHERLASHRHWLSVTKTYPSRQLSYELPVDQETFERAGQGSGVAFSCRIAALIRGKSVYCVPVEIRIED